MKLNMRSLFLKIFLWFWATLIATGISLVLTFIFGPRSVPLQWHATLMDAAHSSGAIVVSEAERGGDSAAAAYIGWLEGETHLKTCLFDIAGSLVAGRDCGSFQSMTSRVTAAKPSNFSMRYGIARVAMRLKGSNGHEYIFATELPAGPRAALGLNRTTIALQWGVALLVSGLICYLLTRYLTAPVLRLREASQQLAAGDLSIRAVGVERRRDELGDLVRDFNAMASRIEELVSRQRQLISDVSHELRSPLARLNVALDLGRERKGNDPAFDHMEQDISILSEMIGRLLTIARLDTSAPPVPMMPVDLTELVSRIVRDADFESRERDGCVKLTAHGQLFVRGEAELLHSAIENLVRNAIRYTEPGTPVEVVLESEPRSTTSFARLTVRDHGPGVPESELVNIFQPFYRVADARDRQSGGAGLGLAIADRVIRLHGGTIRAKNAVPRGLLLEILLPDLPLNTQDPSSPA
jgi:two-component system, OmpR family, sensor histidine kinase CpxA